MAFVDTRLTLFAVISAIETDLRTYALRHLCPLLPASELLGPHYKKCQDRFVMEDAGDVSTESSATLLPYADLGDLHQLLNRHSALLPPTLAAHLRNSTRQVESLIPTRNRVMHIRPLSFDDLPNTLTTATTLANDTDGEWEQTRVTLARLQQQPHFVLGLSIPTAPSATRRHNLPSPDFDDTGFLGRTAELADLMRLCKGAYPVITLLGVGGIGKTSLALKLCYDLLDDSDARFDAIVWASSKTTQLTATDVRTIKDAITTSLGMLDSIITELGGTSSEDPLPEIIEYMTEFRILVVLDNLETVLDDRIRGFLSNLPPGSKVLITSRIGVGAYEHPMRIAALAKPEAVHLLRAAAKSRGLTEIIAAPAKTLEVYCARLKCNPGFIKWFVACVHAGDRPEDVLAGSEEFLDYCMSNVYTHLTENARIVLRAMMSSQSRQNQPELAFVTDFAPLDLQQSLQELLTANMILAHSMPQGRSYDTQYAIDELVRHYLHKHYPVEQREYDRTSAKIRQLKELRESAAARQRDQYSAYSIQPRGRGDLVVARYLYDALDATRRGDYEYANERIECAQRLSPDYSEVYRVRAWTEASQGHLAAAHDAYQVAVELNPDSPALRLWYGGFLLRVDQTEDAANQFEAGLRIDPNALPVRIELARAKLYLRDYDAAERLILPVVDDFSNTTFGEREKRKAWDLALQVFKRRAESCVERQDNFAALEALNAFRCTLEKCPRWLRDARILQRAKDAAWIASTVAGKIHDDGLRGQAQSIAEWANGEALQGATPLVADGTLACGAVRELVREKGFGFITCSDGMDVFFHRSSLSNAGDWPMLAIGGEVSCRLVIAPKGPMAVDLKLAGQGAIADRIAGAIVRVVANRRFGFIRDDATREYFFHFRDLVDPEQWERASVGRRVRFLAATNERGLVANEVIVE